MIENSAYNGSSNVQIVFTQDGSNSLYIPELEEHYHSLHGALQESNHVFINAGLNYLLHQQKNKCIKILEVGFGTGLNCFLTYLESINRKIMIEYHGIEAFPVNTGILDSLNYQNIIPSNIANTSFKDLHDFTWNIVNQVDKDFKLLKKQIKIQDVILDSDYHLIYFDAFGPKVQSEMWTETIFNKLYQSLKHDGILVTYCAKGEIKRILKRVGFSVESIPGPPGKREMTRAVKII